MLYNLDGVIHLKITVRYLGTELYNLEEEHQLDNDLTLEVFLKKIVHQLGTDYTDFINETTVLINNEVKNNDAILKDGDIVLILQVLGGG